MKKFSEYNRIKKISRLLKKIEMRKQSDVEVNTQKIRESTIQSLAEIIKQALAFSKNEEYPVKQRAMWSNVASYTAQVLTGMLAAYDEKKNDKDLAVLEALINEAKAARKAQKSADGAAGSLSD